MTCIVGLVKNGQVYMGGDSAGVSHYGITARKDTKVFRNGPFLMGFTSSFRMGQLLAYKLKVPVRKPEYEEILPFMVTTFIDAVRACLKDGGFSRSISGEETGGTFLVGYGERLFRISDDFQVGESYDDYDAVGCGDNFAIGSLFTTLKSEMTPLARITMALEAAAHHSSGVCAPFVIEGPE